MFLGAIAPTAILAEDLLLPGTLVDDASAIDGPYFGASLGYGTASDAITSTLVWGRNFALPNSFFTGAELSGELHNDDNSSNAYFVNGKLGIVVDRFVPYAMAGVGYDSSLGFAWKATAGLEVFATDQLSLVGELSSTQSVSSLGDNIEAQLGFRLHFDGVGESHGDLVPPSITQSSFVSSITQYAQLFGIDEVRVGGALSNLELSILSQPFEPNLSSFGKARPDTLAFDVFLESPELLGFIGAPRPQFGAAVNVAGYESMIHGGLDWHLALGNLPLYVELGAGLALHNGYLNGAPEGYRNLGCNVLHEWQYGLGYNASENVTITAQWKHISGYFFGCSPNDGINTFGLVAGLKF